MVYSCTKSEVHSLTKLINLFFPKDPSGGFNETLNFPQDREIQDKLEMPKSLIKRTDFIVTCSSQTFLQLNQKKRRGWKNNEAAANPTLVSSCFWKQTNKQNNNTKIQDLESCSLNYQTTDSQPFCESQSLSSIYSSSSVPSCSLRSKRCVCVCIFLTFF